jgi:hypothetical protein
MRDDVDALAAGFGGDVVGELKGALFDAGGGWDRGLNYFDVVGFESCGDAAPVLDTGEERAAEAKGVETEEAVSEDDEVFGCC